MKMSAQGLLIAAVVLLAANLVVMLGVYGAAPAQAQPGRTCVGVAATCTADGTNWVVYRAWSDGTVEARSNIVNTGSLGLTSF
ncbi:hypothetical protein LLH23_14165 [bacterium]|nr:hypothetical protein [bacterium]